MTATDLPDDDWTLPRVRDWINDRFRRGIDTECPGVTWRSRRNAGGIRMTDPTPMTKADRDALIRIAKARAKQAEREAETQERS